VTETSVSVIKDSAGKAMQIHTKLSDILRGKQKRTAQLVLKRSECAVWFVRFVGFSASEVECFSIAGT
jgi:hypothetical protein